MEQTNKEKLNSSDDKKETTSLKVKDLAEQIESQNANITNIEKLQIFICKLIICHYP